MVFAAKGPTMCLHNSISKSPERTYNEKFSSLAVWRCWSMELLTDSTEGFSLTKTLSELSINRSLPWLVSDRAELLTEILSGLQLELCWDL